MLTKLNFVGPNFKMFQFRIFIVVAGCLSTFFAAAQTQEDYNTKLAEVYTYAADKKKALVLAKELYAMVEKKKDLQTYANYYLLKTIFEVQAPDPILAKSSGEKANKALNAVGASTSYGDTTNNPFNTWYYVIYPGLFTNTDPDIATKAVAFIQANPEYKNFESFYYIAFAFERKGDFQRAKENYEKAMALDNSADTSAYHSYLYYTNFLSKSGDYLKAEEYINKMESMSRTGSEMFRNSYKAEAMGAKVVHYLNIGDYQSYIQASQENNAYSSALWHKNNAASCDPYQGIHFTTAAYGKEMMKQYDAAEKLWKSRDSVNYIWVKCHNKTYPNNQYFPISIYPTFMIKRGKAGKLPQPPSFFIKETEAHYNSYSQYADLSINYMKAVQLAFLGSPRYEELFEPLMVEVKKNKNFRESTLPLSNYAWFSVKNRKLDKAIATYNDLFTLNTDWINDIIFTFGEKAFVTYYNAKLKEGYESFHSFVKYAREKNSPLFPQLSQQAYNNMLLTKSISLKGTEKRKEAFLNSNDKTIITLYEQWLEKKQQLIRSYLKSDQPAGIDTSNKANPATIKVVQAEVDQLENQLTLKAKDFKKFLKIVPPGWKTIRDNLQEGEAAIEMIRFEWRDQVYYSDTMLYAAYIITKTSEYPAVVYLPATAQDLDDKYFKQYKNSIKLKIDDPQSYNHYWKPIQNELTTISKGKKINKVYFSPDGIYHLINLAALKNPTSGQFLLDELDVQFTTSSIDIKSRENSLAMSTAVLFGRPTYKLDRIASPVANTSLTRSLIRNFKDNNISDLPGTEQEVNAIKEALVAQHIKTTTHLKDQATENKIHELKSPDILHIATHGYWSPAGDNATDGYRTFNAMVNSGLLLSGVVNYYSMAVFADTYDGILTAYEAQNLDLENTSLVILSACETSLGYLDAGEGVYGLQRAFRAAGAQTVITSLWKVDDAATRDFMISFYTKYLASKNKHAAFQFAQQQTKEKYKHPYYWAAFIMTGE